MYKSPIEILTTDIQTQIDKGLEEEVFKAVVSVGINVDKEELLRALQYDRSQYQKGYFDGVEAATPRWTPVTVGLPENDQTVLCFNYNGEYKVLRWNYIDWMWNSGIEWLEEDYVLFWMPLPEPPKGGSL